MDAYQLIDIAQSTAQRIDAQWALFVTVHLALFGAIVYIDRPLRKREKWIAIFIYTTFALFNFKVTSGLRTLIHKCSEQLAALQAAGRYTDDRVVSMFAEQAQSGFIGYAYTIIASVHVVTLFLVVVTILADGKVESRR